MDVLISSIELHYEYELPRVVELSLDVTRTKLSRIRDALIQQCCPYGSNKAADWEFYVNDERIGFMDAANRSGTKPMKVVLRRRVLRPAGGTKKREREEEEKKDAERELSKVNKATDGLPYEVTRHLVRIMKLNDINFRRELKDNGVLHRWLFDLMGHLSVKLLGVAMLLKHSRLVFQTEDKQGKNGLRFAQSMKQQRAGDAVVVCPYFTPRHVALLVYDARHDRLLHLDASASINHTNVELFRAKSQFKSVSYTYVNYQQYDDSNFVLNLATGNCGMFTGLNAIQCVLKYEAERIPFRAFWERFLAVLELTPEHRRDRIIVDVMRAITYAAHNYDVEDEGRHVITMDTLPAAFYTRFPEMLTMLSSDWLETADFTSDYLMLGYFLDARIGFDQVAKLGNAFRLLLQDVVERGFVSLNVAAAMARLCAGCAAAEATLRCPCREAAYCGAECQAVHWKDGHKDMH